MKNCLNRIIGTASVLILMTIVTFGQNLKADLAKADFSLKKGDYEAAAKTYLGILKTDKSLGKGTLDILYKLGLSQMQIKNFSAAAVSFTQYINVAKNSTPDVRKLKDVLQWKDWCDNETTDQKKSAVVNSDLYLTNMRAINSTLNDFSITLDTRNEIIFFTSNKLYPNDKTIIEIKTNLFNTEVANETLKEPVKIGAEINALGEIISACLASDNKTLYFTVANNDQTKADIYVCKYRSKKFEKPEKLPKIINSKYFDGYPSVSADGKSLYFVSDRPGGIGGKDIYVSRVLPDGTWSEPYNLGKTINTKFDEITPHIDKTNETLYFSSKGHPGNGGYDIFYSKFTNRNRWGAPVNMIEPINSKSDDIAYVTTSDNNIFYLSSSRKGGSGNYDIYRVGKANETEMNKDTAKKAIDFEEFKKLAEKEKQPEAVIPVVVADNTVVQKIQEESKAEPVTMTTTPPTQQPTPTAQPVVNPTTQPVTPPTVTEKAIVKQNTEPPATKNVIAPPIQRADINLPLNKDTAILNSKMPGLVFRVQLGAFRNHITVESGYFDRLNRKLLNEELSPEMYYKYTISTFESISRATNAKLVLRETGYPDAFLACYYKGNRITMDEVLSMLDKYVYGKSTFSQK